MQKHVNLVDLFKSFPTNIFLQNLASIHERTGPIKFDHLAEKSDKGSISNLSTKPGTGGTGRSPSPSPPTPRGGRPRRAARPQVPVVTACGSRRLYFCSHSALGRVT